DAFCSFIRIAAASGWPIQIGRKRLPSTVFRRTIGCLPTRSKLTPYTAICCIKTGSASPFHSSPEPLGRISVGLRRFCVKLGQRHPDALARANVLELRAPVVDAHRVEAAQDVPTSLIGDEVSDFHEPQQGRVLHLLPPHRRAAKPARSLDLATSNRRVSERPAA